ncbi:hypothetical protein V2J09_021915 [Rumex salicifolius]
MQSNFVSSLQYVYAATKMDDVDELSFSTVNEINGNKQNLLTLNSQWYVQAGRVVTYYSMFGWQWHY